MMNAIRVDIPMEMICEALRSCGINDRMHDMVEHHGEFCSRHEATRILQCGLPKLDELLAEGLVLPACDGSKIDVRSICEYIECGRPKRRRL